MIPKPLTCVLLLAVAATAAAAPPPACLVLEQGWVRAPVPGRTMTAGYGQLHNRCSQPAVLARLHSPQAAQVELHRTDVVDGVSRMRAVPAPVLPAGGRLLLAPGGLHLMLHGTDPALAEGSVLRLQLGDAAGGSSEVLLPVRRQPPAGG